MMTEPLGTASKPDYNAIPVQLSEEEFEPFILPHLAQARIAMQAGVSQALHLYSQSALHGKEGKELPIDQGPDGKVEIHYLGIFKLFARGAADGSLEQAFMASVPPLDAPQRLDLSVLHGDGSKTVAKQ